MGLKEYEIKLRREGFEPPSFSINSTTQGFSEGKPTVQGRFSEKSQLCPTIFMRKIIRYSVGQLIVSLQSSF